MSTTEPFPDPFEIALECLPQNNEAQPSALVPGGILLPDGAVTISDTARELFKTIAPKHRFFVQGRVIVLLVKDSHLGHKLRDINADAARSSFDRYVKFFRRTFDGTKEQFRSAILSAEMARALIASSEAREILPTITALSAVPILKSDGSIHSHGYEEASGIYVTANPDVGKNLPNLDDAANLLLSTLNDFRFVNESDRSRAVAAMLAPAIRLSGALDGKSAPLHVYEADQSQTGKGYATKIIAAIYGEILTPVTMSDGRGVGGFDESFKSALIRGRPLVVLDNLRDKLSSQCLESFLTAEGPFECRTAYHAAAEIDARKYVVLATSNGIEGTTDISNRMLIVRFLKQPRTYNFTKYPAGDLLSEINENRNAYMGAVLRVVSEWIKRGKPKTNENRHDFSVWCQSLDWIVRELFLLPPLLDGHDAARQRIADPGLSFLRNVCLALRPSELETGIVFNASQLAEKALESGVGIPGLAASRQHDEGASAKAVGVALGKLFREEDQVAVDRWSVKREVTHTRRNDGQGYFEQKTYRFRLLQP